MGDRDKEAERCMREILDIQAPEVRRGRKWERGDGEMMISQEDR